MLVHGTASGVAAATIQVAKGGARVRRLEPSARSRDAADEAC